jgi:hypothetical protein
MKPSKISTSPKCSICGLNYTEYGNNAWPINEGQCCRRCDLTIVLPRRIIDLQEAKEQRSGE